jgi:hypothetical protein
MVVAGVPRLASAGLIEWTSFATWTLDATTGSIPYKTGTIEVVVSGSGISTLGQQVNPFATTSANYENIDTAAHHVLRIFPNNPSTPWSISFDLVGTTLTSEDVFTAGQLAVASTGVHLTDLTIQMFAPDDVTSVDLTTLEFEEHALISPNFDARLDWSPITGSLQPIPEAVSKNSGWAFFGPTTTEVGRIVITAVATGGPDAINFSFGRPVPEPGTVWLLASTFAALAAWRRSARG